MSGTGALFAKYQKHRRQLWKLAFTSNVDIQRLIGWVWPIANGAYIYSITIMPCLFDNLLTFLFAILRLFFCHSILAITSFQMTCLRCLHSRLTFFIAGWAPVYSHFRDVQIEHQIWTSIVMHQSIPAVTIPPPGIPRGFVRPYVPGAGILYNKVLPRGLGAGTTWPIARSMRSPCQY